MSGWTDFEGIDLLSGFEKIVAKAILQNELGDSYSGYQPSHASTKKSGYSFGGNQMDLAQGNAEYNSLFIDILTNARNSDKISIFTSAEIESINLEKIIIKSKLK